MIRLLLVVMLALSSLQVLAAGAPDGLFVKLDRASDVIDISRHLAFYEDPSSNLNIYQIKRRWPDIGSKTIPLKAYNFGFTDSTYWFHTRVENVSSPNDQWVIEGLYPIIDEMELFVVRAAGPIERQIAGDSVPFHRRARDHHNINFDLTLNRGESVDLYFRVKTSGAVQMRTKLWSLDSFSHADHQERFVLGLFYGLLIAMLIFSFLIFLSIRDTNYLWYSGYIFNYGILQSSLNGLSFEHLWPDSPWWNNRAVAVLIASGMFFVLGFSRSFLALKANAPVLNRTFLAMMGVFALAAVAPMISPSYAPVIRFNSFFAVLAATLVMFAGGVCLYRNYRPARFFMLAWTALLAGMLLYLFKTFGVLPANVVTEYAIQIGSAFEVILLSIALADRLRHMTQETQRIQSEMNTALESRVAERTAALESANRQLEMLSSTDGLTGVFNRRYFDKHLRKELVRCRRRGSLALILLDVDHFKAFNDNLGHQAGDSCLRKLADKLTNLVRRETDIVCRYGGEEFAIVLPYTDAAGARQVANQVRAGVESDLWFEWEGEPHSVTVSIGVAVVGSGIAVEPDEAVAVADEALYTSKAEGRNRVTALDVSGHSVGPAAVKPQLAAE
ncbi:MAG: 7TM diverse intracellular signaling domain-containing protein [Marinobacter sp.]|uniref:sensor domain-containing diguanylate cyclase n=2 Tax=Marinobacter sp. TaxID=50741 RepID=UPI00329896F3